MTTTARILAVVAWTAGILLLLPVVAAADNCSSLSDCFDSAGPAAGSAAGGGTAGFYMWRRRRRKKVGPGKEAGPAKKADPCEGARRAVDYARAEIETLKAKIGEINAKLQALAEKAESLITELQDLVPAASVEFQVVGALTFLKDAVTSFVSLLLAWSGAPHAVAVGFEAEHFMSVFEGLDTIIDRFSKQPLDFARDYAEEHGLNDVNRFFEKYDELKKVGDQGQELANSNSRLADELKDAEDKLQDALDALAACEAEAIGGPNV